MALLAETPKQRNTGISGLPASSFASKAIPVFFSKISRPENARMLDLGPVCNENINLFARKVKKLYVLDGFKLLNASQKGPSNTDAFLDELDYPPGIFDGIALWDLPDRLRQTDARHLGQKCNELLKQEGVVLVYANGQSQEASRVNTFVIGQDFKVTFRDQPNRHLPPTPRKTRDLFDVLNPLIPVQSFIFRNGLREFVLKKKMET